MDEIKIEVDTATEVFKNMLDKVRGKLDKVKLANLSPEEKALHGARLSTLNSLLNVCRVFVEGGGFPANSYEANDGNNLQ